MAAVLDKSSNTDAGVPAGAQLMAFVDAVEIDHDRVPETREALREAVGDDAALEAAATVAIFNGLIRVADGTGIQLDQGVKMASAGDRAALGINDYAGAASTSEVDTVPSEQQHITSVHELFG